MYTACHKGGIMEQTDTQKQFEKQIPLSVLMEQTKTKILDVINTSGLPLPILELLFKDTCSQLHSLSTQLYQEEKSKYEESLKEPAENAT